LIFQVFLYILTNTICDLTRNTPADLAIRCLNDQAANINRNAEETLRQLRAENREYDEQGGDLVLSSLRNLAETIAEKCN
jgi:hypothetical protein